MWSGDTPFGKNEVVVWEEFRVQDVSHCPDLTLMRKNKKLIIMPLERVSGQI